MTNNEKKIEKINYSLKVYAKFAEEFDAMWPKSAGGKGEQLSAGIMAYMAIYQIDKGLASALTNPDLNTKKAEKLIVDSMQKIIYNKALAGLTPEAKARILRDAQRSKDKSVHS